MSRTILASILIIGLVAIAAASTTPEVIELTDSNLFSTISASPDAVWLVEFFAPWCGHCKKLAPTWDELAQKLHARDDAEFRVAKVDCTVSKDIASAFEIRGFPTIKLIKGDRMYDVKTSRTLDAFTEFVQKGSWEGGVPYPPVMVKTTSNEPTKTSTTPQGFEFPEIDPEKLLNDVIRVATKHFLASIVIATIGFLLGLLAALIVCFPSPRIVNLQAPEPIPTPSGPKIKEE